jgi:hypothetical protein
MFFKQKFDFKYLFVFWVLAKGVLDAHSHICHNTSSYYYQTSIIILFVISEERYTKQFTIGQSLWEVNGQLKLLAILFEELCILIMTAIGIFQQERRDHSW